MNARKMTLLAIGVAALLMLSSAAYASPWVATHWYDLNGSYNDGIGSTPITPLGGDLTTNPGGYTFAANQGLWLPQSVFNTGTWIIEIGANITADNGGWKKIADFTGLLADTGFYFTPSNSLGLYNVAYGPGPVLQAGTPFVVDITRDGSTGLMSGYFNGVLQWTYTDSPNDYVINSNGVYLFVDDIATGQREAVPGIVDYVAVGTMSGVPEPGTLVMLGTGILGLAGTIRRKLS